MTPKPYDQWTVSHLYWTIFCGSFHLFVDFAAAGWTDSPLLYALEIAGNDEPPTREQPLPRRNLYCDTVLNTLKRVVNSPVEPGIGRFRGRSGFVGIGHVVVGGVRTLSQRALPNYFESLANCLVSRDFLRAAVLRCSTPLVTALSSAEIAPTRVLGDSSFATPSAMTSFAAFTRLRVKDRVDRFRSPLRI